MIELFQHPLARAGARAAGIGAALAILGAVLTGGNAAGAGGGRQDDSQQAGSRAPADAGAGAAASALSDLATAQDDAAFDAGMRRLRGLARDDLAAFTGQLLTFAARDARDPRPRALAGRVLHRLDVSKHALTAALVPLLDDPNPDVRSLARDLLAGLEDRSPARPPDFSAYHALVEADFRAGREPRASLFRLMYESDAGLALLTLARASQLRRPEELKPILWAEHVVADLLWKRRFGFLPPKGVEPAAVEQVARMARHDRWWARLYAAHVLARHPELGDAALVAQLAADGHALVREAIRSAATAE